MEVFMTVEEKKQTHKHSVVMERREKIFITGVLDVASFDEDTAVAETEMGMLIIKGDGLHVNKLNLDNGELEIEGNVYSLSYEDIGNFSKGKSSFLNKIFK
jgi:sporulation protein YabP